jgi:hypothetical protein
MKIKNFISIYSVALLLIINGIYAQQIRIDRNNFSLQSNFSSLRFKPVVVFNQQTDSPKLRNAGIGLTVLGVGLIARGTAMVIAADGVTYYSTSTYGGTEGSFSGAMGALSIVAGGISTAGGITMWILGQKKLNKEKRRMNLSIGVNVVEIWYRF